MSTVRRQINIDATPRTIWKELTTAEGLNRWLGVEARVDSRQGGRVSIKVDGLEETGIFHEFRPTGRLEIFWDKHSSGPWKSTRTQIQVARDGAESVVHVQHLSSAFEDMAIREPVDVFWKGALNRMRDALEA
jgi:uncharacterized protein YndB with AHSA1/START domain